MHSFATSPPALVPRSSFDLSHPNMCNFDADWLIPITAPVEVLPGDTFNWRTNAFIRMHTLIHPIMSNVYVDFFYFFVPNRIVWDNWEKFLGAQDDPGDSISYTIPPASTETSENWRNFRLCDYFGLPYLTTGDSTEVNGLPFRGYTKIWNDWFRDQNLQDTQDEDSGDAAGGTLNRHPLQKRGKRYDYFTGCLPWPAKSQSVSIGAGFAPITGLGVDAAAADATGPVSIKETSTLTSYSDYFNPAASYRMNADGSDNPLVYADLANSVSAVGGSTVGFTVNDLRLAVATQRLLERDARAGTRINETILAHYGVTPSAREDRPLFLGSGQIKVNVTPVANTTAVDSVNDPASVDRFPGELSAFATASGRNGFTQSFNEHGYIFALCSARADIIYQQGLDRMWSKSTRYDIAYPILANIGPQAVLNKEIYYKNDSNDDLVWGYRDRYDEYRMRPGRICGEFRSEHASSLESWHLAEEFTSLPTLGSTFIENNLGGPLDRALAVPSEPQFYADFWFDIKAARPLPTYGLPGGIGRF